MEYMLQLVTSQRFNAPESDTSKQHTTEHNDSSRGLRLDGLTGITSTAPFRGFLLRTVPVTLGVEVLLMLGIGCWYFAGERIWRRQSLSIGVNSSREINQSTCMLCSKEGSSRLLFAGCSAP